MGMKKPSTMVKSPLQLNGACARDSAISGLLFSLMETKSRHYHQVYVILSQTVTETKLKEGQKLATSPGQ